jgi:perosamine synthetase
VVTDEIKTAIIDQLFTDISLYDNGGIYAELENFFRDLSRQDYVLSVNSGTTALFSAYYGLAVAPGSEVIVPAYTFFATATPLVLLGARIKFADADEFGGIDVENLRSRITNSTAAIVVTHMWGIPCDMDSLIRAANGVPIVEDASHAHGAMYKSRVVGGIGEVGAWSLQGKKILTAGEGGILATSNRHVFERAVLLGHFNRRAHKQVRDPALSQFSTTGTGLNLRMHPFGAALAVAQARSLDRQLIERRESAASLVSKLRDIKCIFPLNPPNDRTPSWYAIPILYVPEEMPGVTRERFVEALHAEGASEVDIPNSTRPLTEYPIFYSQDLHRRKPVSNVPPPAERRAMYPHAYSLYEKMIKVPSWYGPLRFDYANAYSLAFEKVAENWKDLRN